MKKKRKREPFYIRWERYKFAYLWRIKGVSNVCTEKKTNGFPFSYDITCMVVKHFFIFYIQPVQFIVHGRMIRKVVLVVGRI